MLVTAPYAALSCGWEKAARPRRGRELGRNLAFLLGLAAKQRRSERRDPVGRRPLLDSSDCNVLSSASDLGGHECLRRMEGPREEH
jgi:hypothetical protein